MAAVEKHIPDGFASKFDYLIHLIETLGESDECLAWPLSLNPDGYGMMPRIGNTNLAHRVAYQWAKGSAQGKVVRHTCDNPSCINPRHLLLGTQLDNVRDREERNRGAKGVRNGRCKLTEEQVVEVFYSREQKAALARRLGVSPKLLTLIKNREIWKELTAGLA